MTIKEAIRHLRTYSSTNGSGQTTNEQHKEAKEIAILSLKAWEELKEGLYKLHPTKRGDNDYANGVYDGECYVINYVMDFINGHLSEVEDEK